MQESLLGKLPTQAYRIEAEVILPEVLSTPAEMVGWGIAGGTIDVQKVNIASAMIGRRFNQRAK